MSKVYFITSNENKFREIQDLIPQVEQLDVDLPEIQSLDPHAIIKAKVRAAFDHHEGPFIVEDTSISIEGLGGLPGPLVKWFEKTVGLDGIHQLAESRGNTNTVAKTLIGYAKSRDSVQFFEGVIRGKVVSPRGNNAFGWNPIFVLEGMTETFGEISDEERYRLSMRRKAAEKLAEALKIDG